MVDTFRIADTPGARPGPDPALQLVGPDIPRQGEVLTHDALGLLSLLCRALGGRREQLMAARTERVRAVARGETPDFLDSTRAVRDDPSWRVAAPAPGLIDRRVEITGPTERRMAVNALNSGAKAWLADQEDATTPSWANVVNGPLNLLDAVDGRLETTTAAGRHYHLDGPLESLPTIIVRPRGWHLPEKHILLDGRPVPGAFVDFALYLAGAGRRMTEHGKGPYFYLPKMESHLEARLWNDAFLLGQEYLGIPRGTIRATALIETVGAAFEMDEILYELREHSAGLNAGRWDYMFSMIKTFRHAGDGFLLPDRNAVTMSVPFMRAYTELLVRTCHRRGAHAMGGMAAFIPSADTALNERAYAKLAEDKNREAHDGFDGSWVAHPAMVSACDAAFNAVLGDQPHQLGRRRDDVQVGAQQLLDVASTPGRQTMTGLRDNISVGIQYLESWLRGVGAAGINNLMEDAATAEISRSQVWQWLHHDVVLADGERVTPDLVTELVDRELADLSAGQRVADGRRFADARALFLQTVLSTDYQDFVTLSAYQRID